MQIHPKQQGFILFTVLIFLQLFSLFNLYSLSHIQLILKNLKLNWLYTENLETAESLLKTLEAQLIMNTPPCLIPIQSTLSIAKQSIAWWEENACSGIHQTTRYYYAIESLGQDPCAKVGTAIADYYRITLYWLPAKIPHSKIILQATEVKPQEGINSCDGTLHRVNVGRQMIREI